MSEHARVSESPDFGRFLSAGKDLSPGERILRDAPAAIGPDYNSLPTCLGCHKRVDGRSLCRTCSWPLCGELCAKKPLHLHECPVLAGSKRRLKISNYQIPSRYYDIIFPLRVLLLKSLNPETYAQILRLMDHGEAPLDPASSELRSFISGFLLEGLQLPIPASEVSRILGILCINSFILQEEESNSLAGIYPMASLLSHGCVPNTKIITGEDYSYDLEALSDIQEGEMLVFNYTHYTYHLLGTRLRRAELKATWSFDCGCRLCADPTEGSSYLSALLCRVCKAGRVLCDDPLDASSSWTCDSCSSVSSAVAIEQKVSELRSRIQTAKEDPSAFQKLLSRLPHSLSENHYLILEMKRSLIEDGIQEEAGGPTRSLSPGDLRTRISHCEHLLTVIALIFPGRSELKGLILYEKSLAEYRVLHHDWLRMKLGNRGYVEGLRGLCGPFNEVITTFRGIKASFFEGKLCRRAMEALDRVTEDIETLSTAMDWTSKRL